ncbi:MAG: phosphoribosylaminoimidazolesuccinocarboxamide synthase [Candidatus Paceibacterota bacterium]|nr:phosphoribosylaminoimidazolesuccinocarboxamide synthase [Candidatus Paceibacterota bacterium]
MGDIIQKGVLLTEGKTKKIFEVINYPNSVIIQSKDDITAGDGAKHDIIDGKAILANEVTCNVFRLLKKCYIPIAFQKQLSDTEFVSKRCNMVPWEVVIRRKALGSYLKRNPHFSKGQIFPKLIFELFLKTSGKKWKGKDIPCDDPFAIISHDGNHMELFLPDQSLSQQSSFLVLDDFPLKDQTKVVDAIRNIAMEVFLILEEAWRLQGRELVDLKLEFGFDEDNQLLLADVIDNDSWRVLHNGQNIDKQLYRDGADLNEVTAKYQEVAELTGRFEIPRQQIILWRASPKDDLLDFSSVIYEINAGNCVFQTTVVTSSLHKTPVQAIDELIKKIQEVPDSVVIAYCGMSNGAGPTLSAHCMVPVITVPASWKDFHEDVWSSLRTPSDVPVSTVLNPKNAVLHVLQILAMRNPWLYAILRQKQEERLCNFLIF